MQLPQISRHLIISRTNGHTTSNLVKIITVAEKYMTHFPYQEWQNRPQVEIWRTFSVLTETRMWANAQRDGLPAETPQSLADAHYIVPCSNAAKTRNLMKFAGVPQTLEPISAVSGPKFTIS